MPTSISSKVFADEVIKTIPIGDGPLGIAYNEDNNYIYVTNAFADTVSVIDSKTNEIIKTIEVGDLPIDIAYNPRNGDMYVTNFGIDSNSDIVSVIDGDTNEVIRTITVGLLPHAVAYNPRNGDMYVTNYYSQTTSVIDGDTNEVVESIPVEESPRGIAYNPINGDMYVTNTGSATISVIDEETNKVVETISTGDNPLSSTPLGIAFNPNNGDMYVTNSFEGLVKAIDGQSNEIIKTIEVGEFGGSLWGIAYNPINGDMYVTNSHAGVDTVSIIDEETNKVVDNIIVGDNPRRIAANPNNGDMYVTNSASDTVSVLSSRIISGLPPTATSITSSVDGNGNQVQNKSSSVSKSITFEVTATEGTNPIAGFECSLDNSPFSTCSTSNLATIEYGNLIVDREHLFQVRAIDTQGNTDPKPAVFSWTVLTAEQALDKLIETINEMGLSKGTVTSLKGPLNAAAKQLDKNNEDGACGPLGAFLNQVDAKEGNGQLTAQQAAELRQQAIAIRQEIGCANSSSSAAATSQSTSPIDSMIDNTVSNIESFQSKQSGKAIDSMKKGMDLYNGFFGIK